MYSDVQRPQTVAKRFLRSISILVTVLTNVNSSSATGTKNLYRLRKSKECPRGPFGRRVTCTTRRNLLCSISVVNFMPEWEPYDERDIYIAEPKFRFKVC